MPWPLEPPLPPMPAPPEPEVELDVEAAQREYDEAKPQMDAIQQALDTTEHELEVRDQSETVFAKVPRRLRACAHAYRRKCNRHRQRSR